MGSRYEVCKEEKEGQDYESMNALSYTCWESCREGVKTAMKLSCKLFVQFYML
jgi:hypothetical protein